MDFTRAADFYAAPFPSDDLVRGDGTVDRSLFPNPAQVKSVARAVDLIAGGRGFASTGFFQTDGPRHQARCFLSSWLTGVPRVSSAAPLSAPCD